MLGNTHLTNAGVVRVTADDSIGMAGFGDGHEVENFGLIVTQGTLAIGMVGRGGGPFALPGLDLELLNAGRIITEGDLAIGVALGVNRIWIRARGRRSHGEFRWWLKRPAMAPPESS